MNQAYKDLNIDLNNVLKTPMDISEVLNENFQLGYELYDFSIETYEVSCNNKNDHIAWFIDYDITFLSTCPSSEIMYRNYVSIVRELSTAELYPSICYTGYIDVKSLYWGSSQISKQGVVITKRPSGTIVDLILKYQNDKSINIDNVIKVVDDLLKKMVTEHSIGMGVPILGDIVYYEDGKGEIEIDIIPNITVTRFPPTEENRTSFLKRVDALITLFKSYIHPYQPKTSSRSIVKYDTSMEGSTLTTDKIMEDTIRYYKGLPIFKQKVNFFWNGNICDELSIDID